MCNIFNYQNGKMILLKLFFLSIFYRFFHIKLLDKIKVCICTIGKRENKYAREFVEYYKNRGINKIFIYDNNEINDEKFDDILKDYISEGSVKIIDFRGILAPQVKAMEDCRKHFYKKYNWLIFYDMDEYLYLRNFSNIPDFLNQNKFDKCQRIQLNWFFHTDNNLIYYDNRSLVERFPEKDKRWNNIKIGGFEGIKSILKGNINIEINDAHVLNKKLISCDGFGNIKEILNIITNESDHYYYYIDHYYSKSTEEFVNKLLRGSVAYGNITEHYLRRIRVYFALNGMSLEKINYIENKTALNLTEYRIKLLNLTK